MIENKFKETSIGLIPEEWDVKKIGDIFEFKNGLNASKDCFGYGTPIVNYTDVYHHRSLKSFHVKGKVSLSKSDIERFRVKKNDVFFTRTSETPEEVGFSGVLLDEIDDCVFSGFVLRARPFNDVLYPPYCAYCFSTKQVRNAIMKSCTYTTRALTNGKVLSDITIPIPPKEEQKEIADAIASIDELIAKFDVLIQKKTDLRIGVMQQLLSGTKRITGYKDSWTKVVLGEIGFTYNGLSGKSASDFGHGQAKYVTFLNVLNNPIIDCSIFESVDVKDGERQNDVQKGDLLFNTSSETPEEVGICATLDENIEGLYLNSFCFGYRLKSEYSPKFLAYFFRSKQGRELMKTLAQGSTRYNLSKDNLMKSSITIPQTKEEQVAIATVLSDMDKEIAQLESRKSKYEAIKQGMMQQLLTGKIRLIN